MDAPNDSRTREASNRPAHISEAEWRVRIDLAACYRLHAHFGWTDLIYTHISARVPGESEHFLLNPFGLMFDEVTASNLVKIDLDGNVLASNGHTIHRAGFVIHSAIHAARSDAACVIHAHTRAGMAVSCMSKGLLNLTQHAMFFHDRVGCHDSEGLANDVSERERLAQDLGQKQILILRNHGTLVAGKTIAQAFSMMWHLERAMQAQVDVMAMAQGHATERGYSLPSTALAQKISNMGYNIPGEVRANGTVNPMGFAEWPALLRLADRLDASYKT